MKKYKNIGGLGILTAFAASLCCITPILAIIAGTGSLASGFSWLEPLRPYLIGSTVLVLAFAWYVKLKPAKEIECDCDTEEKVSFFQSKKFLSIITLVSAILLSFPFYPHVLIPETQAITVVFDESNIELVKLNIEGMTCAGCEAHVKYAATQVKGVLEATSSFESGTAKIKFDATNVSVDEIIKALNATGYTVVKTEVSTDTESPSE